MATSSTFLDKIRSMVSLAVSTGTKDAPVDAMVITPTANSAAADVLTITNAAYGQATTLTIPDPGASTAKVVLDTGTNATGTFTAATITTLTNTTLNGVTANAGADASAGTVNVFPATTASGKMILAAVNSAGAYNTTISNASMGQSTVVSIPDPGTATANFAVAPAALVTNNYPVCSSTTGKLKDSQCGTVTVTLNTAAVVGAYATPVQLVAAGASGTTLLINSITMAVQSTGNTAFATGGVAIIQYGTTVHGAGTTAINAASIPAANVTAAANSVIQVFGPVVAQTGTGNTGIYFSNQTGAYTNGTASSLTITVDYTVVPIAV